MENGTTIVATVTKRRYTLFGQLLELNTESNLLKTIVLRTILEPKTVLAAPIIRIIT
jgi:hypothetical protein